jgi:hypothetical protein
MAESEDSAPPTCIPLPGQPEMDTVDDGDRELDRSLSAAAGEDMALEELSCGPIGVRVCVWVMAMSLCAPGGCRAAGEDISPDVSDRLADLRFRLRRIEASLWPSSLNRSS